MKNFIRSLMLVLGFVALPSFVDAMQQPQQQQGDLLAGLQQLLAQNQNGANQAQIQNLLSTAQIEATMEVLKQLKEMNQKKKDEPLTVISFFKDYLMTPVVDVSKFTLDHLAVGARLYIVMTLLIAIAAEAIPGGIGASEVAHLAARLPVKLMWGFIQSFYTEPMVGHLDDDFLTAVWTVLTAPFS